MMTHVKNLSFYLRAKFGLSERGVAMTEYAILLAFVAAVGVAFMSSDGLSTAISGAISSAASTVNKVNGKS